MMKIDPVAYSTRGPAHSKAKQHERLTNAILSSSSTSTSTLPAALNPPLHWNAPLPPLTEPCHAQDGSSGGPSAPMDLGLDSEDDNDFDSFQPETHPAYCMPSDNSTTSTGSSQSLTTAMMFLEDALPKMEILTRFLNAAEINGEDIDGTDYDTLMQGMEISALLERQLSRVISRVRRRQS